MEAEREEKDKGNIRIKYISELNIAVSCIVSFIVRGRKMAEGLNLFKQPYSDASIISRTDTDYYPSDAIPDNSKETIQIEVINNLEVDFIDLNSTEILMKLRLQNKADNAPIECRFAYCRIWYL